MEVTDVTNGWQALVLVVLILAANLPAWRNSRRTHRLLSHETKPNHGSSLRDRVEVAVATIATVKTLTATQGEHLAALAESHANLTQKVNDHLTDAADTPANENIGAPR